MNPLSQSLRGEETRHFTVPVDQEWVYRITLNSAQFTQISIEQSQGLVEVFVTEPGGIQQALRANDAGHLAIIRISINTSSAGEFTLRVRSYHPHESASGTISVSAPRPVAAGDDKLIDTEKEFAEAEISRRRGEPASWTKALQQYETAAANASSLEDDRLLRAALTGKARLYLFKLNDYKNARAAAEQAVAVGPGAKDRAEQGLAWKTLSSVNYFLADYPASIDAAKRALDLYAQTSDQYWQGIILGNLAYTYREVGDTLQALQSSQSALDIARSIRDWYGVDFNLEALATIHLSRGDFQEAFDFYHQALDELALHPFPSVEAAVWNGLGELYLQLEDEDRAKEAFGKSLSFAEQAHDTAGYLKVISNLGEIALRQGHAALALTLYQHGLEKADALDLRREKSFLLTGLASCYSASGDQQNARRAFDQAFAIASSVSQKDSEAFVLQRTGDFFARTGDKTQALQTYEKAFRQWSEESNRPQAAVAQASMARLNAESGNLEIALQQIKSALQLIESSRETVASRSLRTSYFSSKHSYYDLAIDILMRLDADHPDDGDSSQAFEIAERARARTLLDAISHSRHTQLVDVPSDLVKEQQRTREQIEALYLRLRTALENPKTAPALLSKLHSEIEKLLQQSDDVESRMKSTSAAYARLASDRPARIQDLQSTVLFKDSFLIEFWVGERASYEWVIGKQKVSTLRLPARAHLDRQAHAWMQSLLARSLQPAGEGLPQREARLKNADASTLRQAAQLGQLLFPAPANLQLVQKIYIVPDGPLSTIPFSALRISGSTGQPHGRISEFLMESREIIQEPSASVLLSLTKRKSNPQSNLRLAVFADPVFTANDPRVTALKNISLNKTATRSVTRGAGEATIAHLPRLAGSRAEAQEIQAIGGKSATLLRMDFDANTDSAQTMDWTQFQIAHFATHAILSTTHPAFSGVVLSLVRSDGTPQKGVLWLDDIYNLTMPVDLVVLSGCRTAEGRDVPGEGLEGLSRAFLIAGASGVIGSLWSVEDQRTSLLMEKFYRGLLARHMSVAAALRNAQRSLAHSQKTAAPYYWAGFSIQGAPPRPR